MTLKIHHPINTILVSYGIISWVEQRRFQFTKYIYINNWQLKRIGYERDGKAAKCLEICVS